MSSIQTNTSRLIKLTVQPATRGLHQLVCSDSLLFGQTTEVSFHGCICTYRLACTVVCTSNALCCNKSKFTTQPDGRYLNTFTVGEP